MEIRFADSQRCRLERVVDCPKGRAGGVTHARSAVARDAVSLAFYMGLTCEDSEHADSGWRYVPKDISQSLRAGCGNVFLEYGQVRANGLLVHERRKREVPAFAEVGLVVVLRNAMPDGSVIAKSARHWIRSTYTDTAFPGALSRMSRL